jgi:hypothetical protein
LSTLCAVALLGLTMLGRWIMVRRALASALRASASVMDGASASAHATVASVRAETPAEGHFPVPVVLGHGVLAGATLTLVLLSVLGLGGS